MVMSEYNDRVKGRFRSDNDSGNVYEPGSELVRFLRGINDNMEAIQAKLDKGLIDIDQYLYEQSLGTITLQNPTRQPWLLTDIIATWTIPTDAQNPVVLQASTVASYNNNQNGVWVNVQGGTVTVVAVNGTTLTGVTSGLVYVPAGGTLTITYSVAPTLTTTYTGPNNIQTAASLSIKDRTYELNSNSGQFQALGMHGMQMDKDAKVTLTISPVAPCFLQIMGCSDYRKIERSESD